jgi:hypothetical protein
VEKVYLHLDKQVYFPGDTIWYKAYTVTGRHLLSLISGVLYVELTGPNDSVINRQTLNLFSGTSGGRLVLPAKPGAGNYHIRAYTNWMRNGSAADTYNHKLLIAGKVANLSPLRASSATPDVQFFPEGGNLVNGLRCRVAIKCVTTNGLGVDASGTIVDNEENPVAEFKTQHLGMGVFAFTPQMGKTYRAKMQISGESDIGVDLPKALVSGCIITLNNSANDSVYVKVAANQELLKERPNSAFYLVGQSGGKIYYTSAGKLTARPYLFSVEKSRFPSGIVQFTLFSGQMEPINERILFIQRDDTLKLRLDSIGRSAAIKQKMNPQFVAVDNENAAVTGSFSVSVTNESIAGTDEPEEQTIFNNLLLTSELKGYIEKPDYYFINRNYSGAKVSD